MDLAANTEARCLPCLSAPRRERLAITIWDRKVMRLHLVSRRTRTVSDQTRGGSIGRQNASKDRFAPAPSSNALILLSIP